MSHLDYDYDRARVESAPAALDYARLGIGLLARATFWLCLWFIVGNAAVQAVKNDDWLLAILEVSFFPATFVIYPFAAHADAMAWPLAEGTTLIPFLAAALIAYPISTLVGGLEPVDR